MAWEVISDQVDKVSVPEHGIEAYYLHEHKFGNAKLLEKRLFGAEEADENHWLWSIRTSGCEDLETSGCT